jgi:putative transposase
LVKAVIHRDVKGKIKSITVSKTSTGKFFASVLCEDNTPIYKTTAQNILGIDLGISSLVVTSDGNKVDNPKFLDKARKKLVRRQRQLSRKQKGSNRRKKAKLLLAKAYEKVTNARNDWQHKLSRKIADENQAVIIETLSSRNMMQNRKLSKAIGDASWHSLIEKIQYKLEANGAELIKINRFYPSSKTCSCCGNIKAELKLSQRMYKCGSCGHTQDRDINAAINIRNEGIKIMAESKPVTARGGDHQSLTTPILVVKASAN